MSNKYDITNINLTDDEYNIEQSLIRNKYKVMDKNEEVVLRGKQKMLKMKEKFPFVNGEGEDAFTVEADSILDVAGTYTLVDSATEEPVVIIDEDLSLFVENWTIRDPDTEEPIATIESKSKAVSVLRGLSEVANLIPNKYEIYDADGNQVGKITGQLSVKDRYEVSLERDSEVPREAVMASACVIDALENQSN